MARHRITWRQCRQVSWFLSIQDLLELQDPINRQDWRGRRSKSEYASAKWTSYITLGSLICRPHSPGEITSIVMQQMHRDEVGAGLNYLPCMWDTSMGPCIWIMSWGVHAPSTAAVDGRLFWNFARATAWPFRSLLSSRYFCIFSAHFVPWWSF